MKALVAALGDEDNCMLRLSSTAQGDDAGSCQQPDRRGILAVLAHAVERRRRGGRDYPQFVRMSSRCLRSDLATAAGRRRQREASPA